MADDLHSLTNTQLVRLIGDVSEDERALKAAAVLAARCELQKVTNYRVYLMSSKWRITRERKVREAGEQCALCPNTTDLQVHHRTYERVGNEHMEDLVVLCGRCHARHHGTTT